MDIFKPEYLDVRTLIIQSMHSPPFKGLTIKSKLITNPKNIVENLASHYEEHFTEPKPDPNKSVHQKAFVIYENISSQVCQIYLSK